MTNEQPFYVYQVIETKDLTVDQLQEVLNNNTEDEFQIGYAVGTKLILQRESFLNRKGRLAARTAKMTDKQPGPTSPSGSSTGVGPMKIDIQVNPDTNPNAVIENLQKSLMSAAMVPKELFNR